jgi:protein-S-isoprenylcysteine O-methyltransferase Ste14
MKKLFELLLIKQDKANHFIYGAIITALIFGIIQEPILSIYLCFIIASCKEVFDGDRFSFLDIIWSVAGGLLTIAITYL